jgi:hypothetical protein
VQWLPNLSEVQVVVVKPAISFAELQLVEHLEFPSRQCTLRIFGGRIS